MMSRRNGAGPARHGRALAGAKPCAAAPRPWALLSCDETASALGSARSMDCGVLLRAVQDRLRMIVGAPPGANGALLAVGAVDRIHAPVLECVDALDTLHATWAEETRRCQAELVATRHGKRRARHPARLAVPIGW